MTNCIKCRGQVWFQYGDQRKMCSCKAAKENMLDYTPRNREECEESLSNLLDEGKISLVREDSDIDSVLEVKDCCDVNSIIYKYELGGELFMSVCRVMFSWRCHIYTDCDEVAVKLYNLYLRGSDKALKREREKKQERDRKILDHLNKYL